MGVPFVREDPVAYGVITPASPMIRRVVAENPSPFTYYGTGTYVLGHGNGVAIIDAGPRDQAHIDAVLAAVEHDTVTHLLVTHTHGDHSPATAAIAAATGATTYGFGPHPREARSEEDPDDSAFLHDPLLATPRDDQAEPKTDEERAREAELHRPDLDFVPDVLVNHGDVIAGGSGPNHSWTLDALHTPGHISNHLCFAFREEAALFSGDHVMGWSTTIIPPPDGDMAQYFASLELLLGRSETTYYPTHGPPIADPQPFVRALLEHRHSREVQILQRLATGPATIGEIVVALYVDVDPVLYKPAARSVHAHLVHLEAQGRVVPDGQRNPRYSVA